MTDNLAPVFLDNKPVTLKDPKPKLSAILSASGRTDTTDVKWLQFQPTAGKSVRNEEVLDRTTDPSKPIYLTSGKGQGMAGQGSKPRDDAGFTGSGSTPSHAGRGTVPAGAKTEIKHGATGTGNDDSGMQDDSEAGGEAGKKAKDNEYA